MDNLKAETRTLGEPEWPSMLLYVAELHERSTHPPRAPFSYPWEEIGPGYCYEPAFGHWDIVHAILDTLPAAVYKRTGTIWEFYHPHGGVPLALARKPHTQYNAPCREYLGHNPLIAMAQMYDQTS